MDQVRLQIQKQGQQQHFCRRAGALEGSLQTIGAVLLNPGAPEETYQQILQTIQDLLRSDFVTLHLLTANHTYLEMVTGVGPLWSQTWRSLARFERSMPHPIIKCLEQDRISYAPAWDELTRSTIPYGIRLHEYWRVYVPLLTTNRQLGVLEIGYQRQHKSSLSRREKHVLRALANLVAVAVQQFTLCHTTDEALRRRVEELEKLQEITRALVSTLDSTQVLRQVINTIKRLFPGCEATIWRYQIEAEDLTIVESSFGDLAYRQQKLSLQSIAGHAVMSREVQIVDDAYERMSRATLDVIRPLNLRSLVVAPLEHRGQVLGAISLHVASLRQIDTLQHEMMRAIAAQAALAIHNAYQFAALNEAEQNLRQARVQELYEISHALIHRLGSAGDVRYYLTKVREGLTLVNLPLDALNKIDARFTSLFQLLRPFETIINLASVEFVTLDLRQIVAAAVERAVTCECRTVKKCWADQPVMVKGDPIALGDAVLSVIENGCEAMEGGGVLEITIIINQERARLCISDMGAGIPSKVQDRLFELGFSTKSGADRMRGRGLFTSRAILRKHQGDLELKKTDLSGTTFEIWLPLYKAQEASYEI